MPICGELAHRRLASGYRRRMRFVVAPPSAAHRSPGGLVRAGLTLLFAAAAASVVGCAHQQPPVVPTSVPTVRPVFANDAEALAAAKKAYGAYVRASDAISAKGGRDPSRIAPFVTASWLPSELEGLRSLSDRDEREVGPMTYTDMRLQSESTMRPNMALVRVYLCADVSQTRLLNRNGIDVTPSARRSVYGMVISFESARTDPRTLLVSGGDLWSGKDFCVPG